MFTRHNPQPPPHLLPYGVEELLPGRPPLTPHHLAIDVSGPPPADRQSTIVALVTHELKAPE